MDYYELLSVDQDADLDTIKRAYRKLDRQHHPDHKAKGPESGEQFKRISEAYRVLSDSVIRRDYDRRRGIVRRDIDISRGPTVRGNRPRFPFDRRENWLFISFATTIDITINPRCL